MPQNCTQSIEVDALLPLHSFPSFLLLLFLPSRLRISSGDKKNLIDSIRREKVK